MPKSNIALKTAIRSTTESLHSGIDKTEHAAIGATDRVTDMFGKARTGFEQVQEIGQTVANVAGEAGRSVWQRTSEINTTLAAQSKAALEDMIAVGQKSFEVKSVHELVALQTEYATRRINAGFEAATAINDAMRANAMTLLAPLHQIANTAGTEADHVVETVRSTRGPVKKTARKG